MAGVICQHRIVHTRIQQRSPCESTSEGCPRQKKYMPFPRYLVVWCVEILCNWITTLGVVAVVGPFCDWHNFPGHDGSKVGARSTLGSLAFIVSIRLLFGMRTRENGEKEEDVRGSRPSTLHISRKMQVGTPASPCHKGIMLSGCWPC